MSHSTAYNAFMLAQTTAKKARRDRYFNACKHDRKPYATGWKPSAN